MSLILDELAAKGSIGVAELAARLGVSTASIRRDLQLLEEQRLLSRTHGGAVANSTVYELPLKYRGGQHRDEKRRIAAAVALRVDDAVHSVAPPAALPRPRSPGAWPTATGSLSSPTLSTSPPSSPCAPICSSS